MNTRAILPGARRLGLIAAALLAAHCLTACMSADSSGVDRSVDSSTGKTGSMARFQVVGDNLYALSGTSLHVYGISDPSAIAFQNAVEVGQGIETLFAREGMLYIGSQTGMILYDISRRDLPVQTGRVEHFRSCDPVVVEGDLAYVTLRGGNRCDMASLSGSDPFSGSSRGGNNELQIVDVRDPYSPVKLRTFPMANPHGLGMDGDRLFLCDGYAGLKVYKVGSDQSLSLVERVDGIETYDVIPRTGSGKILILIAKDGLHQYDYGVAPMRELSVIKIGS